MRITILQGAFLPVPALRGGAIEKAWEALGRSFSEKGHEVTHVSRLCDGLPAEEQIGSVRHFRVKGANAVRNPWILKFLELSYVCLLYTSPSPRDRTRSRMPSSA